MLETIRSHCTAAGLFCTSIEELPQVQRLTVCTKRRANGRGFTGNSVWIAELERRYFVGTWLGDELYEGDLDSMAQFVIEYLKQYADRTEYSFHKEILARHGLKRCDDSVINRKLAHHDEP